MKEEQPELVIDTDVGTDCDDLFALTYAMQAMKLGKVDIKAITTVQGNTQVRAKIARKLERIIKSNIPIISGESCSEEAVRKYWLGMEDKILSEAEKAEPLEVYEWPQYNPNTQLACIGPLTNIAMQLERNPSIKNVRNIYVMGSSLTSHNFVVDLEAKEKVFAQPWNIFQITKEDSLKIKFSRDELEALKKSKLGNFLADSAAAWLKRSGKDEAAMYDVLVVSAVMNEGYVKFEKRARNLYVSCGVDLKLKERLLEAIRDGN